MRPMSGSGLMLYFKFLNDGWLSAKLSMNHTMVDFCGMRFLVIFSNNVYDLLWCLLILYADHQNLLGLNSAWKLCWIVESDKFSQHHILLSAERHVESVAWLVTCEKSLLFNSLAELLLRVLPKFYPILDYIFIIIILRSSLDGESTIRCVSGWSFCNVKIRCLSGCIFCIVKRKCSSV